MFILKIKKVSLHFTFYIFINQTKNSIISKLIKKINYKIKKILTQTITYDQIVISRGKFK